VVRSEDSSYQNHTNSGKARVEGSRRELAAGSLDVDAVLIEVSKGVWGMPRLSEAKKDVVSCEKLRGSANRN
jgi:hypothetical protein